MKPSEVKAVAAVLDEEHGSAVDAAKAAIKALDELRRDTRSIVIVHLHRANGRLYGTAVGPFATDLQARKAVIAAYGSLGGPTASGWLAARLRTAESYEAAREATEDLTGAHHCAGCGHPKVAHINQRWKTQAGTWRMPGCMCCDCGEKG